MEALITRLRGVATDDTLLKFGYQDFLAVADQTTRQINQYTPPVTYMYKARILSGNSYFTIGTNTEHLTEVNVSGGNNYASGYVNLVRAAGEDMEIEVDVHNSCFIGGVFELSDLTPSYNVYIIRCQQGPNASGVQIVCRGSVNELSKKFPNLCEFTAQYLASVNGELETGFGDMKYIRYLALRNTKITGTLEGLCSRLVAAGKEGPLGIICNGRITYQGTAVANGKQKDITFSGGSYVVR